MILDAVFSACLLSAATAYGVDYPLLHAIYAVEGGRDGLVSQNTNGSQDLGRMQINTLWVGVIAKEAGVSEEKAYQRLRDDGCYNAKFAAWILKTEQVRTGDYWQGVGHYHSRTPKLRDSYIKHVVDRVRQLYGDGIFQKQEVGHGASHARYIAKS